MLFFWSQGVHLKGGGTIWRINMHSNSQKRKEKKVNKQKWPKFMAIPKQSVFQVGKREQVLPDITFYLNSDVLANLSLSMS